MSDKISQHHLQRKAILYVRQSSSYQVMHNEESRRLQYAIEIVLACLVGRISRSLMRTLANRRRAL